MKRFVFPIALLLFVEVGLAQLPDTIIVETNRVKGIGPFPLTFSPLQTVSDDSEWKKAIPEIKGLPKDMSGMMLCTEQADFLQFVYQNYHAGKISQQLYTDCQSAWGWKPDSSEFTKEVVKGDIAILSFKDTSGGVKVKVDRNNNYDLSEDDWITLAVTSEKNLFKRYNDSLVIEVAYEWFDGNAVRKDNTWIYIDHAPYRQQPTFFFTFADHRRGEFTINGTKYLLALRGHRPVVRGDYRIKVWEATHQENNDQNAAEEGFAENEILQLGQAYYRIARTSIGGGRVTLLRIKDTEELTGHQVGLKAHPFTAYSLDGTIIDLNSENGKYIFLDFWGTWCLPCREEIPKLKEIYTKYAGKTFLMIGIAADQRKALESFIQENDVQWPQILQEQDRQIIALYGVNRYPTTFLIDPDGKIIAKDIHAAELEKKLQEILEK